MKLNSELFCQFKRQYQEEVERLNNGEFLVLLNECIDLSLPLMTIPCAVIIGFVYGSILMGFIFFLVISTLFLLRVL